MKIMLTSGVLNFSADPPVSIRLSDGFLYKVSVILIAMMGEKLILSFISLLLLATPSLAQSGYPRLRPSKQYWDWEEGTRRVPVHISRLPRNRKLATVGDTLYMLDGQNRIIWRWSSEGPPINDTPVIDSHGTIYVIGMDLLWVALDSTTGKEKWRGTANGRATYTQIKLYKREMYLVVTDMGMYRENLSDRTIKDKLSLCRGNELLWETEIPAEATIKLRGAHVYAVVKRKGRTMTREIAMPQHLGPSIGKVSAVAGSG